MHPLNEDDFNVAGGRPLRLSAERPDMQACKVVVTGASPDRINRNSVMRGYVLEGFAELIGDAGVVECPLELALDVVRSHRPEMVLCFGSCMPDVSDYGPLRELCSDIGACLAFWLHDDPYEIDFSFRAVEVADWVFTNDRWSAMHYDHPRVAFLPMAASPKSHRRAWRTDKSLDVFFCGVAFPNRVRVVRDLSAWLSGRRSLICGADWPVDLPVARNSRLTNGQLAEHCADSWVTLNLGRDFHLANRRFQLDPSTPGPRVFEAAMAGTVQASFVDGLEVTEYFAPDEEMLLFDSPSDLIQQVEALLVEPERARRMAMQAQARAMRDHTYARRAERILATCLSPIR